eukprot:gene17494-23048_t
MASLFCISITKGLFSSYLLKGYKINRKAKKLIHSKSNGEAIESNSTDKPKKRGLENSVKPYKRHLIVCDGENSINWPRSIEEVEGSFALKLTPYFTSNSKDYPVRLTACNHIGPSDKLEDVSDVIIYPESFLVKVPHALVPSFANIVLRKETLTKEMFNDFAVDNLPWKKVLFVCIHAARDRRCMKFGPEVLKQLEDLTKSQPDIKVLGSSHIGGHEFAGTLIAYPAGDWYGNLDSAKASILIEKLNSNSIYSECYRGNGGCSALW